MTAAGAAARPEAHQPHRRGGQIVAADAVAGVPDDGDAGQASGGRSVQGGFERVGVDQVRAEPSEAHRQAQGVAAGFRRRARPEPARADRLAPHVPGRVSHGEDLNGDTQPVQLADQRPVLGQDHVRAHAVQTGEQPGQGDLPARQPGAVIEVDDPQAGRRGAAGGAAVQADVALGQCMR